MRTLATNEKHLLLLLCGALLIAVNLVGLRSFLKAKEGLRKAMIAATSDVASDKSWIDMGSALSPADAWINTHPMPRFAPDEASAQLLKSERDAAEQAGLKITEENLLPSSQNPYGSIVAVSVKLTGPFEGVVKLLINGQVRQEGNLNQLIWNVPETIAYLSTLFTLEAGDLIFTGTPAGVGPVKKGDVLEGSVAGLESLKTTIR